MAVAATDIKIYLSGGSGNTNPNASLGGIISTTQMGTNLFDNVSASEASSGDTEYRGVYVKNTSATDTLYAAVIYILSNTPATGSAVQIAIADEAIDATMETVPDESTAPTGPTFDNAEDEANALSIGDLGPGSYRGVWIKRSISLGASSYANDTFTLKVKGDTSA